MGKEKQTGRLCALTSRMNSLIRLITSKTWKISNQVTWLTPERGSEPTKSQMVNQKTILLLMVNTRTKHSLIKSSKNVTNNGSNLLTAKLNQVWQSKTQLSKVQRAR